MKLPAQFKKLNKRERYGIMVAAGVVGIFIIAIFIVQPLISKTDRLRKNLQNKALELEQMRQLQSEYASLTQTTKISKSKFLGRQKGFTLFSFLDRLAGDAGIKDRISYMKPSKKVQKNSPYKISRVEMKLQSITKAQLVPFLHRVETSRNQVTINRISISKTKKPEGYITVVLQVETIEL